MAENLKELYKQIQNLQKEVKSLGGEGFKDVRPMFFSGNLF
mgnify:CR=1 FL=1